MRTYVLVPAVVAMLLIAAMSTLLVKQAHAAVRVYQPGDTGTYMENLPYWKDQIRTYGGVKAYERLNTATHLLKDGDKHFYAHIFGEALFEIEGIDGFSVCDNGYTSGCYHQFFGAAFAAFGLDSIQLFATKCRDAELQSNAPGCTHGLGHVIVSITGYTRTDLDKATAICDKYFVKMAWYGCLDGVFMEYNIRDVQANGTQSADKALTLTDSNRFEPCLSLAEKYQLVCMRELPHWWLIAAAPDTSFFEKQAMVGSWCKELSGDLSLKCFQGIGYMVTPLTSVEKVATWCASAAAGKPEDMLGCLSGAARRYYSDHPNEPLLCPNFGLSKDDESVCESFATLQYS